MDTASFRPGRARKYWPANLTVVTDRLAEFPPWIVLTQLFIGLGWFRAATEKLIDPRWWSGEVIDDFISSHQGSTLGWYQPFIDAIVTPGSLLIALIVVIGQLVAAISLTTGRRLGLGIGTGIFLNLNFLAAGAVTPSAFYLLSQGVIALWMIEQRPVGASIKCLGFSAATATFLAAASLPFISTLHPREVIEDPAIMFVFGGSLTTLTCLLARKSKRADAANSTVASMGPPATQPRGGSYTGVRGLGGAFSAQIGPR